MIYLIYFTDDVRTFLTELLQDGAQQGGDVHPLHPQTVRPAPEGPELHRYETRGEAKALLARR